MNYARRFNVLLCAVLTNAIGLLPAATLQGQIRESFTEPVEVRDVAASEPGAVATAHVAEGNRVEAGQVLAELQSNDLRQKLRLAELQASSTYAVDSAEALVKIRKRQRDTLVPMLESGHANQAEVEKAILDYEAAFAELQASKQTLEENRIQVDLIRAEIDRRTIRSPISGFVTEIHHRSGEFISAGDPKFATVANIDQLRARFYLLTPTIELLTVGQEVELLYGHEGVSVRGRVDFISPVTDPDSGTTRVDVLIDNADHALRSGSSCRWFDDSATMQSFGHVGEGNQFLSAHWKQSILQEFSESLIEPSLPLSRKVRGDE